MLGVGPLPRQRDRDRDDDGDGHDEGHDEGRDDIDLSWPYCTHNPFRLKHLALLGNLRCALSSCSCCIAGDTVRSLHLAKLDDSVVEAWGMRGVCRFRGAWRRSWTSTQRENYGGFHYGNVNPLESLDVDGDIPAEDLLAVLTAGETAGTLRHVRISGEMQRVSNEVGTKIMSSVARLVRCCCCCCCSPPFAPVSLTLCTLIVRQSAAGCRFEFE
jgi:hypothetical protein